MRTEQPRGLRRDRINQRCTHRDAAVVIGAALEVKTSGVGHRPIAKALGCRPPRSGLAAPLRDQRRGGPVPFTRVLHALDPLAAPVVPTWSVFADAVSTALEN